MDILSYLMVCYTATYFLATILLDFYLTSYFLNLSRFYYTLVHRSTTQSYSRLQKSWRRVDFDAKKAFPRPIFGMRFSQQPTVGLP
ncbi:hypothetical protein PLICRDRAFT_307956 [Plicaturopsis crispa FD-325 SS-3]|nr:hypothetical protein PLICRDRAFT_307956 [Plicaturopsis crispa FD-325 SS-3]